MKLCCKNVLEVLQLCISETTGLKDIGHVENLQDQALTMLKKHIETSTPIQPNRYGKVLLLLNNIKPNIAIKVEKTFFDKIIGSAKIEKLLCDMFRS